MTLEDIRKIVLDPTLVWKPIPGPEDHPEASAFQGKSGSWLITIIGALPTDDGIPIGGAAMSMEQLQVVNLPLDVAREAWERAMAQKGKP